MRRLLSTVLCLSVLSIPRIGSAELPDFHPPDPAAPFDEVDDKTLQAEVTTQVFAFLDTLHRHWGQASERLRADIAGHLERDDHSKLIYLRNIHDHGVLEGYEFRGDSLVRGQYTVLQRPLHNLNEFIGYYQQLKETLSGNYGTPSTDRIIWDNDLYRPLPDYWGVAVMIGHLHYYASWDTEEGTITLELSGDRHSKLLVDYQSHRGGAET